jgi:hypothetical protein
VIAESCAATVNKWLTDTLAASKPNASCRVFPATGRRTMRRAAAFLIILAMFAPVAAISASRPDVRNMSCAAAQKLVAQRGGIVLTTGRYTYERFVSGQRFCESALYAHPAFVRTKDRRSCEIGYVCTDSRPFPFDD